MIQANANLNITITVECPNKDCEFEIDLLDNRDGFSDDGYIYNRAMPKDKGWGCKDFNEEIECPNCKLKFLIKDIEY